MSLLLSLIFNAAVGNPTPPSSAAAATAVTVPSALKADEDCGAADAATQKMKALTEADSAEKKAAEDKALADLGLKKSDVKPPKDKVVTSAAVMETCK